LFVNELQLLLHFVSHCELQNAAATEPTRSSWPAKTTRRRSARRLRRRNRAERQGSHSRGDASRNSECTFHPSRLHSLREEFDF
jgi:hypothetical protein